MERLAATRLDEYSAVEAAIHVGRYALALPFAPGRRVLDVACGEGYGSWLLAQAGATSVDAVDVAPDAIERAAATFADPRISFATGTGEELPTKFPPEHFDLVVSIETIEHVADPRAFLSAIKQVSKPDALVILTCPNDHWYYPPHEANPFHRRKYTFAEFKELSQAVLGYQVQWLIGSASLGFAAVPLPSGSPREGDLPKIVDIQTADLQMRVVSDVPEPTPETASYFIGVWHAPKRLDGAGAFQAISMDAYAAMMVAYSREASQLSVGPHNRAVTAALRRENEILMERIEHFRAHDAEMLARMSELAHADREQRATIEHFRAHNAEMLAQMSELAHADREQRATIEVLRQSAAELRLTIEQHEAADEALQLCVKDLRRSEDAIIRERDGLRKEREVLQMQLNQVTAERSDLLPAALRWRGMVRRVKSVSPVAASLGARFLQWRARRR